MAKSALLFLDEEEKQTAFNFLDSEDNVPQVVELGNETKTNKLPLWPSSTSQWSGKLSEVPREISQELAKITSVKPGTKEADELPSLYSRLRQEGKDHETSMQVLREYFESSPSSRLQQTVGSDLAFPSLSHESSSADRFLDSEDNTTSLASRSIDALKFGAKRQLDPYTNAVGSLIERFTKLAPPDSADVNEPRRQMLQDIVSKNLPLPIQPFIKSELGEKLVGGMATGALGTGAGTLAAIPAAESFLGLETPVGKFTGKIADDLRKEASKFAPDDPTLTENIGSGLASMAVFMVPSTGAGALASQIPRMGVLAAKMAPAIGVGVSTLMESATEAGTVFQDMLEKGQSKEEASKAAFKDFWQNTILIGLTNKLGIFGEGKNALIKAVKSAPLEAIQEAGQSIISSFSKNEPIDWNDVAESAKVGAIVGGGVGGVMGQFEQPSVDQPSVGQPLGAGEPLTTTKMAPSEPPAPTSSIMNLSPKAQETVSKRFPVLAEALSDKPISMAPSELHATLTRGVAAGEEVLLRGGTPEEANLAALKAFAQEAAPVIQKNVSQKPMAEFIGYQEGGPEPMALYNVPVKEGGKTTLTAETLQQSGIQIPKTPTLEEWKNLRGTPAENRYPSKAVSMPPVTPPTLEKARQAALQVLKTNKIDDQVLVNIVDQIPVDRKAFREGYGREYDPDKDLILGESRALFGGKFKGLINFVEGADTEVVDHEIYHTIERMLFDEAKIKIVSEKYGDSESRADAFAKFRKTGKAPNSVLQEIFEKIEQFLERIGNYLKANEFKSADDLFRDIEKGKLKTGNPGKTGTQYKAVESPSESKALEQKALSTLGETTDLKKAGFLLSDGKMVDFTKGGDARLYSHYDAMNQVFGNEDKLYDFIDKTKAVRVVYYSDLNGDNVSFQSMGPLSTEQINQIRDYLIDNKISHSNLEVVNNYGRQIRAKAIDETNIEDMTRFFNGSAQYKAVQTAPIFYSKMEKTIQEKMPSRSMPDQIRGILNSGGVKQEEIDWSGINEWLKEKKGSVMKEDVINFVKANNVQVQEVMKGAKDRRVTELPPGVVIRKDAKTGEWFMDIKNEFPAPDEKTVISTFLNKGQIGTLAEQESAAKEQALEVYNYQMDTLAPTKFEKYTLSGGENYREILLTLPVQEQPLTGKFTAELLPDGDYQVYRDDKYFGNQVSANSFQDALKKAKERYTKENQPGFRSSHFPEPNILAHVRFNDRIDAQGNKVLFIEEIQSDWHQKGRDKGYKAGAKEQLDSALAAIQKKYGANMIDIRATAQKSTDQSLRDEVARIDELARIYGDEKFGNAVPDAPFKKTWHELSLKRMLRYAAENGYDKIAWTTGEQQAERYDLSKQIGEVVYTKSGRLIAYDNRQNAVINEEIPPEKIADYIGKEPARKIVEQPISDIAGVKGQRLIGENLKVGGEGMKGFYDQMIPSFLNKYTKKWGGKVETTQIQTKPNENEAYIEQTDRGYAVIDGADSRAMPLQEFGSREAAEEYIHELGNKEKVWALDITPSMKESVLTEGQPQYKAVIKPSDSKKEIPKDIYEANRQFTGNRPPSSPTVTADSYGKDFNNWVSKIMAPISTRLYNINPKLKYALRNFAFNVKKNTMVDLKEADGFMKKLSKMPVEDQIDFDLAQKNGDGPLMMKLALKHGLSGDYFRIRNILNKIHQRARDVGFDVGYLENYFPRVVKDKQGFMQYFMDSEGWSQIKQAIETKEGAIGRVLNQDEKVALINSMIRGYQSGKISLSQTGNMKDRTIDFVTPELNQFYYTSNSSLLRYLEKTNELIEARKFFGKGSKELEYNNVDETIGSYTLDLLAKGEITPEQEQELSDILRARFNYRSTGGWMGLYKNLEYLDTLGSVSSAITQIEDLSIPLALHGPLNTLKNLPKALIGKSNITMEDIGLEDIAEEFRDSTTVAKAIKKVFKATGFTYMDRLGKEITVNASIDKFRKLAKNPTPLFLRDMNSMFGEKAGQVIEDLKAGKKTDDVKFLAFNEILDVQPIDLVEMPQGYLENPHGRLFYMLKTFTVKRLDLYRNKIFMKLGSNDFNERKEGLGNLIKLVLTVTLIGSGADEIKDLVFNRTTSLKDRVADNIMKLMGLSKFTIYVARTQGFGAAISKTIAPPFKIVDSIIRDIATAGNGKGLATVESVPLVGKLYSSWFGYGAKRTQAKRKKMFKKPTLKSKPKTFMDKPLTQNIEEFLK